MKDKIQIPTTKYHVILNLFCMAVLAVMFIVLIMAWPSLPNKIPTHYNFAGEADSWGSKGSIWFGPIISVCMYVGLGIVEKFPEIWNTGVKITEKNKDAVYLELKNLLITMKASTIVIFAAVTYAELYAENLSSMFMPFVLVLAFGPMAFFLVRVFKMR